MGADGPETHRPGALKQSNKTHKTGRHRSKGKISKLAKGRVSVKTLSRKHKPIESKSDRRNHVQQLRKRKKEEVLTKKRARGCRGSPPHLVSIVPLCDGLDTKEAVTLLETCDRDSTTATNAIGNVHINVPRFKQRYEFICPDYGNLYAMLDSARVADCLLFLLSPDVGLDAYGDYCLSCLFAQGLPTPLFAIQGLKSVPIKKQNEIKKMIQKQLQSRYPHEKLHVIDSAQEGILLLRTVGSQRQENVKLREHRPHILAEEVQFEANDDDSEQGTLKVTGYVRGQTLSVNGLVHLPGWGDFQMSQIDSSADPYSLNQVNKSSNNSTNMELDNSERSRVTVLAKADPSKQESLDREVIPDPMEGEQTWPTEEELAEAEAANAAQGKVVKRVPKGTSEYQAAWIVDDAEEEDGESDDDDDDDDDGDSEEGDEDSMDEDEGDSQVDSQEDTASMPDDVDDDEPEEYESMTVRFGDDVRYDETVDVEEERQMLAKMREEHVDRLFPDEIDTPQDMTARLRFQKYRGLKSFRTSPWDPKENLPMDYGKIFQFANFNRTKKRVLAEPEEEGALPGWYVTVHISNVPKEFIASMTPGHPVVVFGLLAHEQKMSILHFLIKRHPSNTMSVKSKERMIFHVGYRRYAVCPVYSQHSQSDKHKLERFLRPNMMTMATVYAPITFPPASVLMFNENSPEKHELIATGMLHSVNPDRIITKRVVLSGHPFKINRSHATVRYMFFERDDILWFKPVELRTKWGRRGHIKEALGTHGHMKCVFDGQLKSQDTVMMNLYKRMYPKWTYDPRVPTPSNSTYAPVPQHFDADESDIADFFH